MGDFGQRRAISAIGAKSGAGRGYRAGTAMALVLGLGLHAGAVGAQTWLGDTSTDWFDGTNWAGGTAPTPATGAIIGAATFQPTLNADATVNGTTISAGTLTIDSGAILTSPSVFLSGTGALVASGGSAIIGSVNTGGGSLTLDASSATTVTVGGSGTYTATGAVTHESLTVFGSMAGTGTITTTDFLVLGGTVAPTVTVEALRSAIAETIAQADATRLHGTGATSATLANRAGGAVTNAAASAVFARAPVVSIDLADTVSGTIGIDATATNVPGASLTITSTSTITGTTGAGVLARSAAGAQSITTNTVTGATNGIDAASTAAGGTIDIVSNGTVTAGEVGILAESANDGAVTVTGAGAVSGGETGIQAESLLGAVTVSGTGATSATIFGGNRAAIEAYITGAAATADLLVNRSGAISAAGDNATGIQAFNSGTGNVTVTGTGPISYSVPSIGAGIDARSLNAGGGNVIVATGGTIDGGILGVFASNLGTGSVAVTVGQAIGATTAPTNLGVSTIAANGATTIVANAAITAGIRGIYARGTGPGGNIAITAGADVTGGTGISADTNGAGIDIMVGAASTITGTTGRGIDLTIVNGAGQTATVQGSSGDVVGATDGIAMNTGGGNILVQNLDSVTGNAGSGLNLTSGGGMITVTAVDAILGTGGNGILANSDAGAILIQGNGSVGGITGTAGAGIAATSTGGDIGIGDTAVNGAISGGTFGINAATSGAGTIAIVTGADVIGTGSDGILAVAQTGSVTITADAGVTGGDAAIASITTSGAITVGGTGTVTGAFIGIDASASLAGDITVTSSGAVTGTGGTGILVASQGGNVEITPTGTVDGATFGIQATTTGAGTMTVTTAAAVGGTIASATAAIRTAATDGATAITTNAGVTGGAFGIQSLVFGTGGVSITAGADVTGTTDTGIAVGTISGVITIDATGTILGAERGIAADATGAADITITSSGAVTGTADTGIRAASAGGNVEVIPTGAVDGGQRGIQATTTGTGTVTVTTTAAVGDTVTPTLTGILAESVDGTTIVTANADVTSAGTGIDANSGGPGAVTVNGTGNVTGINLGILALSASGAITVGGSGNATATASVLDSAAIRAGNLAGTEDVVVNRTGTVTQTGAASTYGILAGSAGGNVAVTGTGAVTLNAASTGDGIQARSTGGGDVIVTPAGTIDGGARAIAANTTGAGTITVTTAAALGGTTAFSGNGIVTLAVDGDTLITLGGDVTANEDGINASATGTGNITVTGAGNITGDAAGTGNPAFDGIDVQTVSGNILIDVNGTIIGAPGINSVSTLGGDITLSGSGDVSDAVGAAILAQSSGGNGAVVVNRDGAVDGGETGVRATTTGTGTVDVQVTAGNRIRGGGTGVIVSTESGNGGVTIAPFARLEAGFDLGGIALGSVATAIDATAGAGATFTASTSGVVQANNMPDSVAFSATGAGSFVFNNLSGGVVAGMLSSGAATGPVTINNQAGAIWTLNIGGSTTMAGTDDRFNNSGTLNAIGAVTLTGLQRFNNDGTFNVAGNVTLGAASVGTLVFDNSGGLIDMQTNAATGDMLTVTGNFVNPAAGALRLDVDLAIANAGTADRLDIVGTAAGTLNLALANIGAGTAVQAPITLISGADLTGLTVAPTTTGFTLDGGGLVEYSLLQSADSLQLRGEVNSALGAIAGNVGVVSSLIGAVVNRPSGAFVGSITFESDTTFGGVRNCSSGGWARGVGGQASATADTFNGVTTRSGTVRASYAGLQGGVDFGCFNAFDGDWDVAAGITFGSTQGNTRQNNVNAGGILTSVTGAKFRQDSGGAYLAFARGQVFGDVQLRTERSKFTFNNAALGLVDDTLRTRSTSLSSSLSYSMQLENGLSFVPAAGFGITRSSGGRLDFSGDPGSFLQVNPHTGQIVFAGATLVRTIISEAGDSAVNQFITGTVYSDISGPRNATFTPSGGGAPIAMTTGNLGTFGEVSLGASYLRVLDGQGAGAARQLNASFRVDARLSQKVRSLGVSAQIRFQF